MTKMICLNDYYDLHLKTLNENTSYGLYGHQLAKTVNHLIENKITILNIIKTSTYNIDPNKSDYYALIES